MAKKKVTKKTKPSLEEMRASGVDFSTMKASENGTDIREYAQRLLKAQSPTIPRSFALKNVEEGLLVQGWTMDEVMPIIMEMKDG